MHLLSVIFIFLLCPIGFAEESLQIENIVSSTMTTDKVISNSSNDNSTSTPILMNLSGLNITPTPENGSSVAHHELTKEMSGVMPERTISTESTAAQTSNESSNGSEAATAEISSAASSPATKPTSTSSPSTTTSVTSASKSSPPVPELFQLPADPSTPSVPVALNSAVEANRTPSYIHHELGPKPQKPKPNKRFVAIFVLAIGIALVSAVFFTLSLFKLLCPVT
ncbi:hypothetical protein QR680_007221 [Steinernema hermaphroditum]|uniref:Uncharacterized protein n=1 Tax=Steinernema hermaphroditum TaxID=289476 RepID=A0AA39HY08_9BILA|nr:hypothetical protein QR680_007221 [Steinernema hermaphroditum]